MSRAFLSSFHHASFSNLDPENEDLLPLSARSERSNSISMQNLSPQASRSPAVSLSPPPSFYRTKSSNIESFPRASTLSPSPSRRTKGQDRVIQFAAPPPPITGSVVLPKQNGLSRASSSNLDDPTGTNTSSATKSFMTSRRGSGGAVVVDPFLGLGRRERAIQRELQELLDAQSAGLIQGFGGAQEGCEAASEAGSSTPTYDSTRSRSSAGRREGIKGVVVPVRQPKTKVVSLRGARRGLLRNIGELAAIKGEEVGILSTSIAQRESSLRKVEIWEQRINSFQKQLSSSASSSENPEDEEGRELAELRDEERAIDNEIREMEDRLAQMRARKKWIRERVREGENRREARLSSYRGALREVEGEVREFLKRPPTFIAMNFSAPSDEDPSDLTDLPAGRRTLGMAHELWTRQITHLQTQKSEIDKEREALEEGAKMWEDSARAIMEFEDELRKQMAGDMRDTEVLGVQVRKMGAVIKTLGANVELAEEKGWNLLICAVGAELEAFKEGESILKGALGLDDQPVDGVLDGAVAGDNILDELDGEARGKSIEREDSREDSEDDGPNLAELLVDNSHGDGGGDGGE